MPNQSSRLTQCDSVNLPLDDHSRVFTAKEINYLADIRIADLQSRFVFLVFLSNHQTGRANYNGATHNDPFVAL